MYYKNSPDSDLLTGKGLVIGGSHQVNKLNENVQYGDLSAVLMQNSPGMEQLDTHPRTEHCTNG